LLFFSHDFLTIFVSVGKSKVFSMSFCFIISDCVMSAYYKEFSHILHWLLSVLPGVGMKSVVQHVQTALHHATKEKGQQSVKMLGSSL